MDMVLWLQQAATPWLTELAIFITNLGNEQAYIAFLLIVYLAVNEQFGHYLGTVFLLGYFLNFHLKGLINTSRPYIVDPAVGLSPEAIATGTGPGFPSGHAQASIMFWGMLAAYVRKVWMWVVAVGLVFCISLTRVYLGVHFPIDVIGGLIIGMAVVIVAMGFFDYHNRVPNIHNRVPNIAKIIEGIPKPLPKISTMTVGIAAPFLLHALLGTASSEVILGGLAAFITAPVLVPHTVPDKLWQKVAISILGLVLTFATLLGSSLLLPETIKRSVVGGFIRYLLLGYTGLALTPWIFSWCITRLGKISNKSSSLDTSK